MTDLYTDLLIVCNFLLKILNDTNKEDTITHIDKMLAGFKKFFGNIGTNMKSAMLTRIQQKIIFFISKNFTKI